MNFILDVKNLEKRFELTSGFLNSLTFKNGKLTKEKKAVHAVNGVSFAIKKGEVFSLVGESGCGKSTTARTVIKLYEPNNGEIFFEGNDITNISRKEMLKYRSKIQMIFQDPYASLNPRQKVIDIIMEPILFHKLANSKQEAEQKAFAVLEKVGIRPEQAYRFPHQFSGGQRQRIGIARALALEPELIVADEPVSALDVSIQAQILNLMMDLKEELNLSYLFIAHDLSVIKHISDRIGVMYLGKIVETGTTEEIFSNPKHPYTKALLEALPKINGKNMVDFKGLKGEVQSPINLPKGCYFCDRCNESLDICHHTIPVEQEITKDHYVSCHLYKGKDNE